MSMNLSTSSFWLMLKFEQFYADAFLGCNWTQYEGTRNIIVRYVCVFIQ